MIFEKGKLVETSAFASGLNQDVSKGITLFSGPTNPFAGGAWSERATELALPTNWKGGVLPFGDAANLLI